MSINQVVLAALAEAEAAAIHVERARMGVEAGKAAVEASRAALEASRGLLDEAKGREATSKAAMDEILVRFETQGVNRKSLRQAVDDRLAALLGGGLLSLTPLGVEEEQTAKPRPARATRKAAEPVAEPQVIEASIPATKSEASVEPAAADIAAEPAVAEAMPLTLEIEEFHQSDKQAAVAGVAFLDALASLETVTSAGASVPADHGHAAEGSGVPATETEARAEAAVVPAEAKAHEEPVQVPSTGRVQVPGFLSRPQATPAATTVQAAEPEAEPAPSVVEAQQPTASVASVEPIPAPRVKPPIPGFLSRSGVRPVPAAQPQHAA